MRGPFLLLVALAFGCSNDKQEPPKPAPAPAPPKQEAKKPPATPPPPAAAPGPRPEDANVADLTITGAWQGAIKGAGASCINRTGGRAIDNTFTLKVNTRDLKSTERNMVFTVKKRADKDTIDIIQLDVETDEPLGNAGRYKKVDLFVQHEKAASVKKAELAPDLSSFTVDATLATRRDGKTVHVTGTVRCGYIYQSKL